MVFCSLSLSQCVSIELDPLLRNEPRRASFRFLSFLLFRVSITADHHDGSMNPARPPAARDLFKLHHYFRSPWVCTSSFFFLFLFIFLVGCRSLLFLLLLLTNAEWGNVRSERKEKATRTRRRRSRRKNRGMRKVVRSFGCWVVRKELAGGCKLNMQSVSQSVIQHRSVGEDLADCCWLTVKRWRKKKKGISHLGQCQKK